MTDDLADDPHLPESPDAPTAEAALEKLCRAYWLPLYIYVRRLGSSPHDAEDLTQGFFALLLEKNYLRDVAREKGRFRSFLLASLKHFLSHERDRARAAKRGGGKQLLSLDETGAEQLYSLESFSGESPEDAFEKRWAASVLETAFASLREEHVAAGKGKLFEQVRPFLVDRAGQRDQRHFHVN